jgi:hypothetical protein
MKKPPAIATALLLRLGPDNECIIGDLLEEYEAGRSRRWYWRQVLSLVATSTIRQIRARPARTVVATTLGWATLLLAFALLGDRTADGMARLFWNWNRESAYAGTLPWWPFAISAGVVSYAGFALSALVVSRVARPFDVPILLGYAASVTVALAGSAMLIEMLTRRTGAVPMPHPLFYIVSVTLPYQWRSGLVLVPLVIILCGLAGRQRSETRSA